MKKIFSILFCLIELTLPVLGGNLPGGISPEIPSRPTVADGPQVSVNVTTGSCNPNTNQYTLSGTINLINAVAGSLTITDGSATTTVNVTAGQTSASFNLAGLQAGSGTHTVTVSGAGANPTTPPTTGSFAITGVNTISCTTLSPTQRQIKFTPQYTGLNGSSVTFAVAGELTATTTPGPYTLNLYADNPAITLNALQSNVQSTFRYNWLNACNGSSSGYSASTTYTAPASCATTTAQLSLAKRVDKARGVIGDIMTYTLVITNNSSNALNNVVVRDSMSTGLTYQANSATPPAGTVFAKGALTTSTWTINSLAAGQTLSLTLRAKADSAGVLYNVATTTGVIAKACTSIPIKVCTGDTYIFRLILDPGRTNYKWFRNDVEIAGQTSNILDVTAPGAYRMSSNNSTGTCTEYSCCPFIIEEEALPAFQASAQAASCSGNTPQNNASITLAGFNTSHSFQYSAGSSFNPAASLSGAAQTIPANGVLVSNLANPASAQSYTIRVYNGAGCYTDATVQVQPANCSSPGGPRLALALTPGSCSSATNQYTLSGTISLTNAVAASLTITDGSTNTTVNVTAGQTSASFSLAGLASGSGTHTVSISGAGYSTTSATYTAPASCSTTPTPNPPMLALSVTPGSCNPTTNQYTLSGTISLTNAVAASLTITDGSASTTLNVTAGQTSASFNLAGLASGSGNHTVTVSGGGYNPTTPPATGIFAIAGVNTLSCSILSPTQRRVSFTPQYTGVNGSPITFAMTGQIAATTTAGPYTRDLYTDNPAIAMTAQQGSVQSSFTYRWLEACNNGGSSTTSYAASATYTAPASCSTTPTPGGPQLSLAKRVDKARGVIGDIMTYTLVITNNSSNALNNVVVRDSMSTGLTYQANSATPPAGTVFAKGALTTSTWTINSLAAGQTLSLTLRAKADSAGVLYNVATTTGVIAKACTSIPIKVCAGTTYGFRITAEPGQTNYKWFRNDVEIAGQTSNILDVTAPGAYRMSSNNSTGTCTEYSCCPFIIEEEALPAFQASAQAASCSGNTPQNNASITLAGFNTSHSFQYSAGSSFNPAASLSGAAQTIPANGVLVSNLANPASAQSYTIRVYNGAGCYTDATVQVQPANCSSPGGPRLALALTPGSCSSATNQYTLSGTISLTNAVAASLTITDGSTNTTVNVTAGQTSASFSLAGLASGSGTHTVSISGAGYSTTSATYTAPASCSTTPTPNPPMLALSVTPGSCNPTTNQYTLSGTISLTNAVAASLTITDGSASTTLNVTAGQTSASFNLAGLASGSGNHTVTVSGGGYNPTTPPTTGIFAIAGVNTLSCSILSPTQRRVSFTPQYTGVNGSPITFAMTGQIAATTTAGPYTRDLYTDNPAIAMTAQQGSVQSSFTYRWLEACNNGGSSTTSYAASATYTAPASCSTTPTPNPPMLALSVTPGSCNPTTNQYTLSGTISLTNAVAASLTITDGSASTTLNVTAGQTSASFNLAGLASGSGNHTVTVSGGGYNPTTPPTTGIFAIAGVNTLSCSILSPTQRRVSFTPQYTGVNGSPITFAMTGQIAATTTAGPYTRDLYTDNPAIAMTAQQGSVQSSFTYRWLEACNQISSGGTPGYTVASATYSAPTSCSIAPIMPPTLALSVTPGSCNPTTNRYTLAGTITLTNAVSSSLLITDGTINKILPVTAGQTTASFDLTGLTSGSGSHTVIVSDIGYSPVPPTSPAHIAIVGVTTVNCLTLSAGLRQVLFVPEYAGLTSEPISFSVANELLPTTNPGPYSLKLYVDNPMITLYAQQGGSHDSFRYNWLQACSTNPGSTTNSVGYKPVSVVYSAPVSCTVSAPVSGPSPTATALALSVIPETCDPATNQYKLTGVINLTNAIAGSLLVTDGSMGTIVRVTDGQTSANFSLVGLASGTGARKVTVSESSYTPATFSSDGPFAMPGVTTISCVAVSSTQRQVTIAPQYTGVNGSSISFSVTNELLPTTATGPYVLNLYIDNPAITLNAQQGQEQRTFLYKWLEACKNSRPVSQVYATASTDYTAPAACVATPRVSLAVTPDTTITKSPNGRVAASPGLPLKLVDKSKAKIGDILTYTLVLTNSGTTNLVNAVVRDSASTGLTYVPNSATAPAGTIFTPGNRVSTWTVASLAPNESLSLVFKAKVDTTGILYNTATVQGDTAIVCTSVPVKVCPGSVYSFSLVAKQGRSTYRWFRDGREITGQTNHILVVTAPGSYSLDPSGGTGLCPDFSCCPFIVEFDTLSSFKARTVPITCTNGIPRANGQLVVSEFDPVCTYQYSAGAQFNPSASLSGGAQPIPTDGVLVNNLANPASSQPYTVRVYNKSGCYRDVTTMLVPTVCTCPADACVPFVIQKNKRVR